MALACSIDSRAGRLGKQMARIVDQR